MITTQTARNTQSPLTAICPECHGRRLFSYDLTCATCQGAGTIQSEYAAGYRVRLTETPGTFIVTNPAGRDYNIEPKYNFCGCPATVECRHLRNLRGLLLETAQAMAIEANTLIEQADNSRTYRTTQWGVVSGYEGFAAAMVTRANRLYRDAAGVKSAAWEVTA
jgi:hypothetical protein